MRIISRRTLKDFWEKNPEAEQPLKAWFLEAKKANWRSPADIKARYAHASFVGDNRVVFNIGGNKFRLVVWINYAFFTIYIRFVGTHREYDKIDVTTV